MRVPSRPARLAALAAAVAALAAMPAAASAYEKPPGGKWTFQSSFDYTTGGAVALSKDGSRLVKLVLRPGERFVEDCGRRVALVSRPKLRKFRKGSGRWAIGRMPGSLILPVAVRLTVDGDARRGRLLMLFDHSGRLANTASVEHGDCRLSFNARKGR